MTITAKPLATTVTRRGNEARLTLSSATSVTKRSNKGLALSPDMAVMVTKRRARLALSPALAVTYYQKKDPPIYLSGPLVAVSKFNSVGSGCPAGLLQNMNPLVTWFPSNRAHLDFEKFQWLDLPTFPVELTKIDWKSSKRIYWDTATARSGIGRLKSCATQARPRIRFSVRILGITDAQQKRLFDFVQSVGGASRPFLWLDSEDNHLQQVLMERDESGRYRVPIRILGQYTEYAPECDEEQLYWGGAKLDKARYSQRQGIFTVYDEDGSFCNREFPEIRIDCRYFWRVAFVDSGFGIEKIFYDINQSQTFEMEVVR